MSDLASGSDEHRRALQGKTAIVTGGGTGIGRGIALALAREGARVAIAYSRSESDAHATVRELEALSGASLAVRASVRSDAEVCSMVATVIAAWGRLDVLVNCAGATYYVDHADLAGMTDAYWAEIMDVNVTGLFRCCRAAAEHLQRHRGCILNVTSVAGLTGAGSCVAYAASKAAANSVTRSLARALAPNVRVNAVAPGLINTRWTQGQDLTKVGSKARLGREGEVEDIAEVALALIAHAGFVTGQTVVVDGGANL